MAHPNEDLLRRGYEAFGSGDMDTVRETLSPDIVWHVAGNGQLSGDYRGIDDVLGLFGRLFEMTQGNFRFDIHDIIANDTHGVVLATLTASVGGKDITDRQVHVWHAQDGRGTEFWGYAEDQAALDEVL